MRTTNAVSGRVPTRTFILVTPIGVLQVQARTIAELKRVTRSIEIVAWREVFP